MNAREKLAETIADYVATNRGYRFMGKRDVAVATVNALTGDAIGVKVDLSILDALDAKDAENARLRTEVERLRAIMTGASTVRSRIEAAWKEWEWTIVRPQPLTVTDAADGEGEG